MKNSRQVLAGVLFTLAGISWTIESSAQTARLEPPQGGLLVGVNLAWGAKTIKDFNEKTGFEHACYVDFTEFPRETYSHLDSHVAQVAEYEAIYLLTLEPMHGLDAITPEAVHRFAEQAAAWREKGARLMIRFAHEMNGGWYPWSMRPALYRAKFRLVAQALRQKIPDLAMVWAPNEGGDYPYWPYQKMTKQTYLEEKRGTEEDWILLDTNGDGILFRDDPYTPFYPGDDVVDWVGMTVYHWGSAYPWHFNTLPESNKFEAILTGSYAGPNGDQSWAPNFYATWAEGRGKPMMIPETSAYYRPGIRHSPTTAWPPFQTQDEIAIKGAWIAQVFGSPAGSIQRLYPRLRMVNWFNHYKQENEAQKDWVDWTVTRNPEVLGLYRSALQEGLQHGQIIDLSRWKDAMESSP